jgi:GWxTD domain-containing protein
MPALPESRSFRDWIKTPEAYYATPEDRAEWARVGDEKAAERFIAEYWARRGGEPFRKRVQSRIEFADKKFGVGSLPGSRSARGRVWLLLGTPRTERIVRTSGRAGDIGSRGPNIFERQSLVRTVWIYKPENLPAGLGLPELTVYFQTDVSRGFEVIENPEAVEPHLAKVAELSLRPLEEVGRAGPSREISLDDRLRKAIAPLWKDGDALGGARFLGNPSWNAHGEPFYALQFFLPGGIERFAGLRSALFAASVRDLAGTEVSVYRGIASLQGSPGESPDRSFERALVLPNGRYRGVFALLSPDGQALLTGVRTDFELAPAPKDFHVSELLMTDNVQPLDASAGSFEPFVFGRGKYVPKGDGRFRADEKVGYFVLIRNPAGEPEVSVSIRMTFYKDEQPFVRTPAEPAELVRVGDRTYLNANAFEVGTFPPGRYRFIAQFQDLKAGSDSAARNQGLSATSEFEVVR